MTTSDAPGGQMLFARKATGLVRGWSHFDGFLYAFLVGNTIIGLWVLALRVHRLVEPVTVTWDDGYGGCTSWVELAGLPDDPASVPSRPALSDVAFAARLKGCVDALPSLVDPT